MKQLSNIQNVTLSKKKESKFSSIMGYFGEPSSTLYFRESLKILSQSHNGDVGALIYHYSLEEAPIDKDRLKLLSSMIGVDEEDIAITANIVETIVLIMVFHAGMFAELSREEKMKTIEIMTGDLIGNPCSIAKSILKFKISVLPHVDYYLDLLNKATPEMDIYPVKKLGVPLGK